MTAARQTRTSPPLMTARALAAFCLTSGLACEGESVCGWTILNGIEDSDGNGRTIVAVRTRTSTSEDWREWNVEPIRPREFRLFAMDEQANRWDLQVEDDLGETYTRVQVDFCPPYCELKPFLLNAADQDE